MLLRCIFLEKNKSDNNIGFQYVEKALVVKELQFKSLGQAFSKACGVKGQSHLSPSADGEIPCLRRVFLKVNCG